MRKFLTPLFVFCACFLAGGSKVAVADSNKPILVELFTSEGCSSCPPADAYLQKLDQQPIAGAQLIVLSEHVDYWNHLGWKDPYSSRFFSDRQSEYARRFGIDGPYTPQIVLDGATQFVGNDQALGKKNIENALTLPTVDVHLTSLSMEGNHTVRAHLQTAGFAGSKSADVYLVIALNRAESHVANGENSGRTLSHVSVATSMIKVGEIRSGEAFSKDVALKLPPAANSAGFHVVAFLQESHQGKVLGATSASLGGTNQAGTPLSGVSTLDAR